MEPNVVLWLEQLIGIH